jgi:hypothetical protein
VQTSAMPSYIIRMRAPRSRGSAYPSMVLVGAPLHRGRHLSERSNLIGKFRRGPHCRAIADLENSFTRRYPPMIGKTPPVVNSSARDAR